MFSRKKIGVFFVLYVVFTTLLYAATPSVEGSGIVSILFSAFISGLLLTFTPCVLPMVPIISSIIVGQAQMISKARALMLSSSYVMGTTLTYTLVGVVAGATGGQLQAYAQNVWVISMMSIVFVVMALSMFGVFTIELPSSIQTRLNNQSQKIKGGSIVMVFLLGAISALILGACVSPILISFLSVAIGTGDPTLGGLTMFFLALGMGVPLIIAGLGAGHLLPKAGEWMNRIKYFFGVMLLAVAITIFNSLNLLPDLLLWGVLFVVVAIYMGATESLGEDANGWRILEKGLGTVLLIWGALLLIGTAYNQSDILRPLPKNTSATTSFEENVMLFKTIKSAEELETRLQIAKEKKKLVVIYFYTDWCSVCKKLKNTTLIDPRVNKALDENYMAIKINMTDEDDKASQAIRKQYQIYGPPVFVFYDREGNKLESETLYGYQDPKSFYDYLGLLAE